MISPGGTLGKHLLSVSPADESATEARRTFNTPCRPANATLDLARRSPRRIPDSRSNAASDLLFAERFVICASSSSALCALRIEISGRRRARNISPRHPVFPAALVSLKAMIFETPARTRKAGIKAARRARFDLIVTNICTRARRSRHLKIVVPAFEVRAGN